MWYLILFLARKLIIVFPNFLELSVSWKVQLGFKGQFVLIQEMEACVSLFKKNKKITDRLSIKFKVRWWEGKMTDLCPLPKPAPHGEILRFIYEKDGGMTREETGGGKQKDRQKYRFEKRREQQQDRGKEFKSGT